MIRAGTVSDELVLNVDLAPTLYDLAGLKGRIDWTAAACGRFRLPRPRFRMPAGGLSYVAGYRGRYSPRYPGVRHASRRARSCRRPPRPGAGQPRPAAPLAPVPTWRALRSRTYKYAVYVNGDLSELYDLKADPMETRNSIHDPSQKSRIQELHRRLLKVADEVADPLRNLLPKGPSLTRSESN